MNRSLTVLASAALAALALLPLVGAGAGEPHGTSELLPPGGEGTARASIAMYYRPGRAEFRLRAEGLARGEGHALRLVGGGELGGFRSRRSGRGRITVRTDRLPEGVTAPFTGLPVRVVRLSDGIEVLEGVLPGSVVGGGGGAGGGVGTGGGDDGGTSGGGTVPTTRLAGVDGLGPYATDSAVYALPTVPGGLAPNSTRVYFPTSGGGALPAAETFPPVVFVHGFSASASNYGSFGTHLASWGFVVLIGDHTDPLFLPDNEKEVKTALGYVDWLAAENASASSRFFGKLQTTNFGILGHSLGGGAAVVAAARTASAGRVKAAVGLAPAALSTGLGGSAIRPDATTGFWPPTLVLTGTQDQIVAPATSKASYYAPAPAGRFFLRMKGFCHTGFGDNIPLGDYNASTCVTGAEQLRHTRQYLVPWFLWHLKADSRVKDYVDGSFSAEDLSVDEKGQ